MVATLAAATVERLLVSQAVVLCGAGVSILRANDWAALRAQTVNGRVEHGFEANKEGK
jgi:hypothetical protein